MLLLTLNQHCQRTEGTSENVYMKAVVVYVCVCSKEKQSADAECLKLQPLHPRRHTAAEHQAARLSRHEPHDNTDGPLPSRNVPPVYCHPRSSGFHAQWDFHSAALDWHPPNEGHHSVVDASAVVCTPPHGPCRDVDHRLVDRWNHSSSDHWQSFELDYPVDQFASSSIPPNHITSFSQPLTHHSWSGGWTNGQLSIGHGYSGHQWDHMGEWNPAVSRHQHGYRRSRYHQSRSSKSRTSASANCNYH